MKFFSGISLDFRDTLMKYFLHYTCGFPVIKQIFISKMTRSLQEPSDFLKALITGKHQVQGKNIRPVYP